MFCRRADHKNSSGVPNYRNNSHTRASLNLCAKVWTVQRSIQLDRFCHRTFFSYADSVFRGCAGDEFLYKTCLGNVERVTPTPGALFDDSSRKLIALDITNTWPTIYFGAFFATRTSGARCFELDLKSLESLGPDEVLNMKNAKNLENVPIPRQLAAIVDPGAQTNNMGCCGSETAILNFDCTDGSCGPSVVLRNFCWQNALHISIGTVHIYFLCAGKKNAYVFAPPSASIVLNFKT